MSEAALVALLAAAVLIGVTGAWSPCGLSMVETVGPTGHTGGLPTTLAALATFLPGCLIGGAITFGGLALLGGLLHGAGKVAYVAAAAIAIAAALAELRGLPIRPQIRRQLPEHWRRTMPMQVASGLYGGLLGLGFTTFVLSFGVWALAGIAFAVGDAGAGLVIGVGFGLGRALPVLALAPISDRPGGRRATELMTQNPLLYRGFRAGDAVALGAVAAALLTVGAPAVAERTPAGGYFGRALPVAAGVGDPSWSGGTLVAQRALHTGNRARRGAVQIRGRRLRALGGGIPTAGGPYIALRRGDEVALLDRRSLDELARIPATDTDALAVSAAWLVERVRSAEGERLQARPIRRLDDADAVAAAGSGPRVEIGPPHLVARVRAPGQLSRPALAAQDLLYTISTAASSRLRHRSLTDGRARTLLAGRLVTYTNPALLGRSFAYVRTTRQRQEIRIRSLSGRGLGRLVHYRPATSLRDPDHGPGRHRIPTRDLPPRLDRDPWTIWSLALAPKAVYATLTRPRAGAPRTRLVRFLR